MTETAEIFSLGFYLLLLLTISLIQRKELHENYKKVLKAIGISLILPFFSILYAQIFSGSVEIGTLSGMLWYPGLPIAQVLICLLCIYKFKKIRPFLTVFFLGETVALIIPYFLYSMVATGDFI